MQQRIYISGMHSGQNPCSGVGIARSIKKAFPSLRIVGVDHWQGSSGLHDASIDEPLILPLWNQVDNERHARYVRSILDEGHLWIPAIDTDVHWFSKHVGPHESLLAPGGAALELSAKPAVKGLEELGFRVPEFIPVSLPDSEIHEFLRHNSWRCWLKSPYHDAKRVTSWAAFDRSREAMTKSWKTSNLFVQKHVFGNEESIAFAAYRGELVAAVHMEKRLITPEGKTWAGRISRLEPELHERFKSAIRRMEWNGGGEIEYVRDPDGNKYIIECNPRFPAWIFGTALTGMNVPGALISHACDLPLLESASRFPLFTRVVQEIAASEAVGLPLPPDPTSMVWVSDGKKGKGGPVASLIPDLHESSGDDEDTRDGTHEKQDEPIPELYLDGVSRLALRFDGDTPARVNLDGWTQGRFQSLADRVHAANRRSPEIRIGYSVKTSPTDEHLSKARDHGFFAECISQMEVHRALRMGFEPHEIMLNGPGKFWPLTRPPVAGVHTLFCDSVEEFERVVEIDGMTQILGFRMRLPCLPSRFGNSLDDFETFQRILSCVRKIKGRAELGFHFHMASWSIGVNRWMEALRSLLIWCQSIERLTLVPVRHLDLGGGFFPNDLQSLDFKAIQTEVSAALPEAGAIYLEPGRALTQDGEVLVTRVLDVRHDPESGEVDEVVVDGCIAELPLAMVYHHRIFYQATAEEGARATTPCRLLNKGSTRILGRICMEDDILSHGVDLPKTTRIGDLVIFGDAGAYERTMSYDFGRG